MDKKILIISNPGEIGAENYCEGVNVDVTEYIKYFTSPLGGAWKDSEILHIKRPTIFDVRYEVQLLEKMDYSLIIFCGHGWYSSLDKATILELKSGQNINEMELRKGGSKRTILLDCCRQVHEESIAKSLTENLAMLTRERVLSHSECRKYYEHNITAASSGIVITHACEIDETAGDSSKTGGYYSGSLRECATEWFKNDRTDLSKYYNVYSIVSAHSDASYRVKKISGGRQNPHIEKPKSEPYFPFAIIAG